MRNLKTTLLIVAPMSMLVLAFQNCGGSGAIDSEFQVSPSVNKDLATVISDPTTCVDGTLLGIWLDPDHSGVIKTENYLGEVNAYRGDLSHEDNYNYFSASAHPVVGPTPKGFEMNVFFYEDQRGEYSLNFFANLDEGGSADNIMNVKIDIKGNNLLDDVLLSDDRAELTQIGVLQQAEQTSYLGKFHYWKNTDGGVIGPLKGDNFIVHVELDELGDNNEALFYSSNGSAFKLKPETGHRSSFIIRKKGFSECSSPN